jgi:hypothetical protein
VDEPTQFLCKCLAWFLLYAPLPCGDGLPRDAAGPWLHAYPEVAGWAHILARRDGLLGAEELTGWEKEMLRPPPERTLDPEESARWVGVLRWRARGRLQPAHTRAEGLQ